MSRKRSLLMALAVGLFGLLMALSQRYHLQAQTCGPGQVWVCVNVFDPNTGTYREVCSCCEAGSKRTGKA